MGRGQVPLGAIQGNMVWNHPSAMTEETENPKGAGVGVVGGGAGALSSAQFTRLTVDIEIEVLEALDKARNELGLRSRSTLLNQLLREVLITDDHRSNAEGTI
jgi:hypothetical protein